MTPLTAVGVLVRGFSTELEVVPPRVSRKVLMADTAAAKVIGVLEASFNVKPVAEEFICNGAYTVRKSPQLHTDRQSQYTWYN